MGQQPTAREAAIPIPRRSAVHSYRHERMVTVALRELASRAYGHLSARPVGFCRGGPVKYPRNPHSDTPNRPFGHPVEWREVSERGVQGVRVRDTRCPSEGLATSSTGG